MYCEKKFTKLSNHLRNSNHSNEELVKEITKVDKKMNALQPAKKQTQDWATQRPRCSNETTTQRKEKTDVNPHTWRRFFIFWDAAVGLDYRVRVRRSKEETVPMKPCNECHAFFSTVLYNGHNCPKDGIISLKQSNLLVIKSKTKDNLRQNF